MHVRHVHVGDSRFMSATADSCRRQPKHLREAESAVWVITPKKGDDRIVGKLQFTYNI
ncbi:hypothetical protein PJF56_12730 [Roseofilum sp. BLCC_M91]|uniref:Uncharacterized protein n=1 Tax=Roseofilum halophilum BLCC-M91 TaxID=3022259 RepID=A0ABT7BKL3_9CYAN|nr:hypothetical protein [Roseofilum halophilum]MDJ1179730.1 hypothetical protein [Roseofilum halophilum BLCC-M91]